MSTSQARPSEGAARTDESLNSPTRTISKRPTTSRPQASTGTGFPANIEGPGLAFTQSIDKDAPRGNQKYDFMMREMGYYGHFLSTDKKANKSSPITLDCSAIRAGITKVLTSVLETALVKRGEILQTEITSQAAKTAATLTSGCMLAMYCRLRTVNKGNLGTYKTFIQRPHAIEHFEVPVPYALAFQYLGIFRVENLSGELELIPTVTPDEAKKFCVGNTVWSPTAYQLAVEQAKSLGIRFQRVDQTVKLGSAWWLLKSVQLDDDYQLQACLPESNFTSNDAVIRALWCAADSGSFHLDIADLSSLKMERGSFLRSPPPDIALTCFYGMMESSEDLYDIS